VTEGNLSREPLVRVWFMDVGNGDCTLVVDEATKLALIVDCPSSHVNRVRNILSQENATLHTCVVTHWDADHYGGVSRLAVGLSVSCVMYNHDTLFDSDSSPPYAIRGALKEFLNLPNAATVLTPALAGAAGSFGRVSWRLLAPNYAEVTRAYVARRRNVASAVVDLSVPNARILIGGDAVAPTWSRLLAEGQLEAEMLRWPHHGAELAGDPSGDIRDRVLASVQPRYVVISTGADNPYGHPSSSVIRHAADGASVLCTQVTAGCFGYESRIRRRSDAARDIIRGLEARHCAGTVCVACFEDTYNVSPSFSTHAIRIGEWPQPLCQSAVATSTAGIDLTART
jgi:beta-lactamase superfamily II metal-dependent hydrolase